MPGARGVKRTASKASSTAAAALPKNKKKRVAVQLEIPTLPKKKGRVFTCGQGDVGQLGLGEDVLETTRFRPVTDLKDNIVQVVAGGMHTVALDSDGKVWTFGCNDEGALGRAGPEALPGCVALPGPAVLVSAGDSHSAALLQHGGVAAWGAFRDSHGSMGLVAAPGGGYKAAFEPVRLELPEPVAELASGQDHLVLLTVSGAVYTLGCGEQGQLGRLAQRSASRETRQGFSPLLRPGRVSLKAAAARVWAGAHGSAALLAGGAGAGGLLAWGLNNYWQLGVAGPARRGAVFAPAAAAALAPRAWAHLALAPHHSVALDAAGAVHALGRREYGRLGLGAGCGDAEAPLAVPALGRCVHVAAAACSSFAVSAAGALLAWGMGSEGQLGTGAAADCEEPTPADTRPLAGLAAHRVSAGGQHTVLLAVPAEELDAAGEDVVSGEQAQPTTATAGSTTSKKSEVPVTESSEPSEESTARPKRKIEPAETNTNKKQKVNGDDSKDNDTKMDVEDIVTEKPDEPTEKKEESPKPDETTDKKAMDIDKNTSSDETSSQDSVQQDVLMKEHNGPTSKPEDVTSAVTTVA